MSYTKLRELGRISNPGRKAQNLALLGGEMNRVGDAVSYQCIVDLFA